MVQGQQAAVSVTLTHGDVFSFSRGVGAAAWTSWHGDDIQAPIPGGWRLQRGAEDELRDFDRGGRIVRRVWRNGWTALIICHPP